MSIATLVIGIGGTGVYVLRALKKLWREELENSERINCAFIAFDFDRSALESADAGALESCRNETPISNGKHGSRFTDLDDDEFFYLYPKPIQELLKNLDRGYEDRRAWEDILEWFPDPNSLLVPASEVEANGASQLRMLGRLGFFLNDDVIESQIRRKLACLATEVDHTRLSEDQRVILVSSLAGGTGAGMLVDMAYIARRQESHPKIFAHLLLPEAFQDVDTGGRIFQNSYASLKELAYLKDQQIPFNAKYYRIPPVHVQPGEEEPFARLFLYRGDRRPGAESIKAATLSMAEAIVGQLDRAVQDKTLAIVSNTLSSDPTDEQAKRRTHIFSTVTSIRIRLDNFKENIPDAVLRSMVRALTDEAYQEELVTDEIVPKLANLQKKLGINLKESVLSGYQPTAAIPERVSLIVDDLKSRLDKSCASHAKGLVTSFRDLAKIIRSTVSSDTDGEKKNTDRDKGEEITSASIKPSPGSKDSSTITSNSSTKTLESARVALNKLRDVVITKYDEDHYIGNLAKLRAVPVDFEEPNKNAKESSATSKIRLCQFDEEDRDAKNEAGAQIGIIISAIATMDPRIDHQRVVLSELRKCLNQLWTSFSAPPSDNLQTIHQHISDEEKLNDSARDAIRKNPLLRLFRSHLNRLATVQEIRVLADYVLQAIQDDAFQSHMQNIFRTRTANCLKQEVENAIKGIEQEMEPGAALWIEAARPKQGITENLQSTRDVPHGPVFDFVRRELVSLVSEARNRIKKDDTDADKERKLAELLEQRIESDPELRDYTYVLEMTPVEAERRIREGLVRGRQAVFDRRTPNVQRKGFTLIMFPKGLLWPGRDKRQLKRFLETTAMQILCCPCQVEDYGGSNIWIYHEDLFNPPEHIRNIDEYYRLYNTQHQVLFHIDKRFLQEPSFKEINARYSILAVKCGNQGCRENIANVSRKEIICPGCRNLIRSRCGNPLCALNELQEQAGKTAKSCPRCAGFNHAAWWCCSKHGKLPVDISVEKERCPQCIEAYLKDPVAFPSSNISLRPDLRSQIFCPACEDHAAKDPEYKPFKIPSQLMKFYREGVNGHDREDYLRLARNHNLPEQFRCPECRSCLIPVDHHDLVQRCNGGS